MNESTPLKIAVIGAGPVGLALALHAAATLADAEITLFDARPIDNDVSGDPRKLALSLGSVQLLQRLGAWNADSAQPITEVHVSQDAPSLIAALAPRLAEPELTIRAIDEAVPMLGAVLSYGQVVAPLQAAGSRRRRARRRGSSAASARTSTALKNLAAPAGVEVDTDRRRALRPRRGRRRRHLLECGEDCARRRRAPAGAAPRLRPDRVGRRRRVRSGHRRCSRRPASRTSASRATGRPRCCR